MPAIWCKVGLKGRTGEVDVTSLLNSGSDLVVLPKRIAKEISPNPVGDVEVELANGKIVRRKVYEVDLWIENPDTGEKREAKVQATIEERDYPLIGISAMEKLKIVPDVVSGKILFK
jgi:predicted aspartyl protease